MSLQSSNVFVSWSRGTWTGRGSGHSAWALGQQEEDRATQLGYLGGKRVGPRGLGTWAGRGSGHFAGSLGADEDQVHSVGSWAPMRIKSMLSVLGRRRGTSPLCRFLGTDGDQVHSVGRRGGPRTRLPLCVPPGGRGGVAQAYAWGSRVSPTPSPWVFQNKTRCARGDTGSPCRIPTARGSGARTKFRRTAGKAMGWSLCALCSEIGAREWDCGGSVVLWDRSTRVGLRWERRDDKEKRAVGALFPEKVYKLGGRKAACAGVGLHWHCGEGICCAWVSLSTVRVALGVCGVIK